MAIEIVDFPIKHGDFPLLCKRSPEGKSRDILGKSTHGWSDKSPRVPEMDTCPSASFDVPSGKLT